MHEFLGPGLRGGDGRHEGAFARELQAHGAANITAGAGDQGDLSIELPLRDDVREWKNSALWSGI